MISHGASSNFTKINYFPKHVKNRSVSWAQYMRGFVQVSWKAKIFRNTFTFAHSGCLPLEGDFWRLPRKWKKFWETRKNQPASMPTTWEVSLARKYFLQNTLTKSRFCRDKWRGIVPLHVPWQVHNHSSDTFFPTRAGRPCAMTVMRERQPRASNAGLQPARRWW